jgi:hypothetical protein
MPRDVEIFVPPPQAVMQPPADIAGAGDTGILMLLGMFSMIDAVLVVLWGMM